MRTRDLPGCKRGRSARYAFRSFFFVVLTATGVFAGTALPSSTPGAQPAGGTAALSKQALALERADLSTLAGIKRYLRASGVDPRSVVIQRGHKNYAGPNCPGAGWNCTNANSVVQVGMQNTHECEGVGAVKTPGTPAGFQECLIIQTDATKNIAKCVQKSKNVPFIRQRCSIMQTGAYNEATIVQVADQVSLPPVLPSTLQELGALQEVGLLQQASTSINRLQIDQEIKQLSETTATGITQDQDAYQVVGAPFLATEVPTGPAQQFAVVKADNSSQIVQKQIQRAKGAATQKQNDGIYAPTDARFGGPLPPADCHMAPAISPAAPNACINFEQTAAEGTNHQGQLSQSVDMEETTSVVGATQMQHPAKFTGGVDARVHQLITGTSGKSQNQASQSEKLKMLAPPGATQNQHGGAGCCGFGSQFGGVANSEAIEVQKDLKAVGGTVQTATIVVTSSSPTGTCALSGAAQTNGGDASRSVSDDGCTAAALAMNCTESGCQETDVAVCEPGEEPDVDVDEETGDISVSCEGFSEPSVAAATEPLPAISGSSP